MRPIILWAPAIRELLREGREDLLQGARYSGPMWKCQTPMLTTYIRGRERRAVQALLDIEFESYKPFTVVKTKRDYECPDCETDLASGRPILCTVFCPHCGAYGGVDHDDDTVNWKHRPQEERE